MVNWAMILTKSKIELLAVCFLILTACIAGCGQSGPELAPVSGRVTVDGQPMENVDVTFQPDEMRPASYARTDADGHYELGYKRGVQGALLGQHTVRIKAERSPQIAAKFNSQSELRREVKAGQNEFDFDVTTEGK
jgi:predicted small lipoprotein YifL